MQKLGWPWTVKIAAVGLVVAITGCDSSKSGSGANPDAGGTNSSAGAGGHRTSGEPALGGTSPKGGAASGGAASGGAPISGAPIGGVMAAGAPSVGGATTNGGSISYAGKSGSLGGTSNGGIGTTGIAGSAGKPGACAADNDCGRSGGNKKRCSVPSAECVECLTAADCVPGSTGVAGAPSVVPSNLACVNNACVTYTSCVNSLGCQSGQVCSTSLGRCVQCVSDADCPTGARCGQNQCRAKCTSDKECTPMGMLCNASAGYCVACNSNIDCPANQYCSGGECLRDVCTANATRCQSNALSTCAADGSAWSSPSTCASSRTCVTNASGVASCQPWVCTPSSTGICSTTEEKVISCSADGMAATTVNDCASKSQVCLSGACAPVVCAATKRFCQDNAVRTCSTKGESSTLYSTCSTGYYCDAVTASCKAMVCTPNQPVCNGSVATICDPLGAGYTAGGTDCAAGTSGLVCSAGTCQAQLCTPSSYFCDNASVPNTIKYCATSGLTASVSTTCSTAAYCDATGTSPTCKTRVCTPGTPACNGNIATTCNSLGSGYVAGGTDCSASSLICSAGTCQNLVCSPSTYFCDQTKTPNVINYCASTGLTSSLYTTCSATQYCDATTTTSCKTKVCTAGQPACNGNIATTCNAQGSGYATGGADVDCTAANLTCNAGVCATAAVDAVDSSPAGSTTYTASSTSAAGQVNFYKVTTNRTLTQIELYLGISTSVTLTWAVYEASTQTGTYTQVLTRTTTSAVGTGYQSSGAISVPLRSGYFYAVQVAPSTTTPTLYYRNPTLPITISFGTVTSASTVATTTVSYSTASYIFPQRLTTTN